MSYKTIGKTVYKVHDFVTWQKNDNLVLSPSFQRRSVWNPKEKSYLIDTVVKGLPIPIIFLRERMDLDSLQPIREVVDGQQRLRTLISYIDINLLKDSNDRDVFTVKKSHNQDIADKQFSELDRRVKQRILNYEFSVHILSSDTEDSEVLQIFARMNSTGVKLKDQELRNAEYFGVFKNMSYELAYEQLGRWRNWGIFSEQDIARMYEVEETSDLVRMMLEDSVLAKSQPKLNYLYKIHDDDFPLQQEVSTRFRYTMNKIDSIIGKDIVNTPFSRRGLFTTLFTFFYDKLYDLGSADIEENIKPRKLDESKIRKTILIAAKNISDGRLKEDLLKVLRGGTGNLDSRKTRLAYIQDIYKEI